MFSHPSEDVLTVPRIDLLLYFCESEVNDVMVMNFLPLELLSDLEPYFMQQINFIGRKLR